MENLKVEYFYRRDGKTVQCPDWVFISYLSDNRFPHRRAVGEMKGDTAVLTIYLGEKVEEC